MQFSPSLRNPRPFTLASWKLLAGLLVLSGALTTQAQLTQVKAANATALSIGSSWVSTTAPGPGDIGEWNSVATATGDTIASLGGAYSIGQIMIANNVAGAVRITDTTSGDVLILNGATGTGVGLDMSAAGNNLTIGTPVTIGASQTWKILGGKNLYLTNGIAFGANTVTIVGSGTINNGSGVNYNPDQALAVPATSSAGGGLNINGASFIDYPEPGAGVVNNLGINTALTMTPSATAFSYFTLGTAASAGNSSETFSSLTLNPGSSLFYVDGRASSSGNSIGFAKVFRNGGSLADFQEGSVKSGNGFSGNANTYALPSGPVNGYATTSQNDWAQPVGTNTILAVAAYVNDSWTTATNNTTVTVGSAPPSGSTINSLRFGANVSPTLTLSGANIITSGGILLNSTFAANVATLTGGTLTSGNANADGTSDLNVINNTAASGSIVFNTVIADNGTTSVGLTVGTTSPTAPTSVGAFTLNSANTFSGTTHITKGSLLLNNTLALQNSTFDTTLPGTLNFGTLTAATFGGVSGSGVLALPAGFALTVGNNNKSSTLNGAISGGGSVTKTGTGTFTLNGANGYTGVTTISAGTVALGASGSLNGPVSISSGGTLDVSAAGNYALAAAVSGVGTINGNLALTNNGQLSAAGTTGTLTLNAGLALSGGTVLVDFNGATHGVITIGGNLTLKSGTVQVNNTGASLANGTYHVVEVPTGTITGSGSVLSVSGFDQPGQAAAMVANAGGLDLVITTYIAQNLTWVGDAAELWNINGDVDWYDNTSSSTSVFHNGDNVTFDDTSVYPAANLSGTLSPASVTVNSVNNAYTFQGAGSIGGSATLADNNSGVLTVLTVNSFSGGTTISAGATINVGNGTVAGSLGSGPVVDNSVLTYDLPAGTQIQGAISGSGTLTVIGAGTVVLNGADTLNGTTTVTSGGLKQGAANTLPSVGPVVVNGTLYMGGLNGSVNNLTGNGTINNTVAGNPVLTVTGGGTFAGLIENTTGSLGLNVNGTGTTLELTGTNNYTGITMVTAGTLQLGSSNAIGGGTVNLGSGGTLDLNGYSPSVDALTGSGVVDDVAGAGTPVLIIGNNGGSGTFPGVIQNSSGTVSLIKNGAGTETLTGDNTYSGATTVNGGTLAIATGGTISTTTVGGSGYLVNGGTVNISATSTLGDGVAFLETSGTVNAGTLQTANDANGSSTIEITGGTFNGSISMYRVVDYATAPTAAAPIAANQASGFYVDGNSANVTLGTLAIGTANSSASARLDAGNLTVNGEVTVGRESTENRWDIFQVNGGFFTDSDTVNGIVVGPNDGTSYNVAEVYFSGPSTNVVGIINFGTNTDTVVGTNWMFINGGASLYMGGGGIVAPGVNVNTIELTSGLLGATANWSSKLAMNLNGTNFTLQPADTSGNAYNISLSGTLTIGANTSALTISGFPGGSGGTVTLTGANQYNGGTLVTNNATLAINGIYALGGANYDGLTLNGGTLQYTNYEYPANGTYDLTGGTNSIVLGNLGGTIDVNGNSVTYGSPFGGSGSLTVSSTVASGVLNLLTNNTYTGNTIVGGATLSVNNTLGSATGSGNVTVAAGGTLDGNGIISGAVEIQGGGILAPGNGVGAITVGALTLDSGSFGNFEFNGTANDRTVVANAGGFVLNDGSDTAAFNLYAVGSTAPWTTAGAYKLIQFSGTAPALDSSWTTVSGTNPHIANPQPNSVYSFAISGGFLTVTIAGNGVSVAGIWTNTTGGNWSVGANWNSNPNVPHLPGDSATFGAGTALSTVTLNAAESVGTLTFNNNNSYVVANGGHPLTLDNTTLPADIYVLAGTANQIQAPLALNDNTVVSVSAGQQLAVSGIVANAVTAAQPETLAVNGAGTLVLAGNNTYGPAAGSGYGTTLSGGGIVKVANNNALAAGDVSVAGAGTLQAGAAGLALPNNIDITSGATATVDNNGQNVALNGNITDSGALTKIGNGTLILNGNNTFTGAATVDAGVLSLSASDNVNSSPTIILDGGELLGNGTFSLNPGIGIGPVTGPVGTNALLDAASGQSFSVAGTVASAGNSGVNNLVVNSGAGDSGTVILSGANTFNGTTVIANGVLDLQGSTALQDSTLNYDNQGGSLVFDGLSAATLGGLTGAQSLALTNLGGGAVTLSVGNASISNNYSGSLGDGGVGGALTKVGTATLTLSGSNSLTGTVSVSAGTLELPAGSYLYAGGYLGGAGFLVDGGTLINSNANTAFAGGNAIVETSGSVTTAGTFRGNNNDGTLFAIYGGYFSAANISLQRTYNNGSTLPTGTAPIAAVTTSGIYVDSTNPASPAVADLGTLTIGTANSSASFREDAGTVVVTNGVLVGHTTNVRLDILQVNGGIFDSLDTTNGVVLGEVNGTSSNNAELYLSGGTTYAQLIAFGTGADTTVGSAGFVIVNGGSLYLGSLGFTNADTSGLYTYLIALNGGLLGALGNLTITNDLQLTTSNFTFQAADNNGLAQNITLDGVVSGVGGVVKSGGGQLTLNNNADWWTGSTIVTNGELSLEGYTSITNSPTLWLAAPGILDVSGRADDTLSVGAVPVSQTLEGNGTINGKLVVGAHGTVAPGAALTNTASLTVSGSVTLSGVVAMNLNRAGSPNSDKIASPAITAGGTLTVTNLGGALHANDTFQLFSTAVSGAFATVSLPTIDAANNYKYTWSNKLANNGTIVVLTAAPLVNTGPTNITATVSGSVLTLSWPADHTGWTLQVQTNSLDIGLSNNWVTVPGSSLVNAVTNTVDPTMGGVFYRLVYTNTP
jgi:autotransporter-associated beta strand protein